MQTFEHVIVQNCWVPMPIIYSSIQLIFYVTLSSFPLLNVWPLLSFIEPEIISTIEQCKFYDCLFLYFLKSVFFFVLPKYWTHDTCMVIEKVRISLNLSYGVNVQLLFHDSFCKWIEFDLLAYIQVFMASYKTSIDLVAWKKDAQRQWFIRTSKSRSANYKYHLMVLLIKLSN